MRVRADMARVIERVCVCVCVQCVCAASVQCVCSVCAVCVHVCASKVVCHSPTTAST
jgi:hypothetical protein